jgi:uncharacterized repeat protein (TIGR04076 family)
MTKHSKGDTVRLKQLEPTNGTTCPWHAQNEEGRGYEQEEIVYEGTCPWLYHTLYPYFLGFHFGARYHYNENGDCNVGCPAAKGVDTIVRKVENDPSADPRIEEDWRYLAYAEVTAVHGDCPYKHHVGEKILFTTGMPKHFLCPAAFNNVFPLMRLKPPSCIDMSKMRCPDYEDVVYFEAQDHQDDSDVLPTVAAADNSPQEKQETVETTATRPTPELQS